MGETKAKASDSRAERLGVNSDTRIKNYRFGDPSSPDTKHVEPIGLGGSSVVYKVYQELDAKANSYVPRALKLFILRPDILPGDEETSFVPAQENFLEEVRNISRLAHESLVQVTDAGVANLAVDPDRKLVAIPYVVSHLIEGCTLRDVVEGNEAGEEVRQSLLAHPETGLDLVLQMARGIAYLHERGFLHCDIAPKNVFVDTAYGVRAIVGDVGMSRFIRGTPTDTAFVAGTRSYSPSDIAAKFGSTMTIAELSELFPRWDLFGFSKTASELLELPDHAGRISWLTAAKRILADPAKCTERFASINELIARLEYCRPVHRQRGRVEELEPNLLGSSTRLMPIEGLSLTRRVDRLVRHPAVQRLHGVPQLTVVKSTAPGGSHTRYEHSLGVMENMRRMLSALIDNPDFLEVLSEVSIETGLVAALLHNATRFPFSNIVHEINKRLAPGEPKPFPTFTRESLFNDILGDQFRSLGKGHTLTEMIADQFPAVDMTELRRVLQATNVTELVSREEAVLHSLLNSSLDARVIDFVRRDSLHLGLSSGDFFSIDDLLPHLRIQPTKKGSQAGKGLQVTLRSSGVSVAEQIILMRYWLYTRVYWNVPNRAYNASLRRTLLDLKDHPDFQEEFRSIALHFDEHRLKRWLLKFAQRVGHQSAVAALNLLAGYETRLYKQIYERNRRSCETDPWLQDGSHMDALVSSGTSYGTMRRYEVALDEWLRAQHATKGTLLPDAPLVLVDVPFEPGSAKLGDDIFVSSDREVDQLRTLSAFSPVVQGVNQNFTRDLQRLRIFLHPDLDLDQAAWPSLGSTLYAKLRKLLDS